MSKKLLIGGSPCTYWSIAKRGRQTVCAGEGWELFLNYLIAKEKFQPDFFLYENNFSIHENIKNAITNALKIDPIMINSSLVSAQNRKRLYWCNWANFQPKERGICVRDILENGLFDREKSNTILSTMSSRGQRDFRKYYIETKGNLGSQGIFMPVQIGTVTEKNSKAYRVYSVKNKSVTLCANGGGMSEAKGANCAEPAGAIHSRRPRSGREKIAKAGLYKVDLPDGDYQIRKPTVAECCRLQTLPDDYCRAVSANQAYKGLGNGWTAEVIIHLLSEGLKAVPKDEKITVISMYDGIGTGRFCLEKMGFANVKYYAYETDKFARMVAKSNFPDIKFCGNAFNVRRENWSFQFLQN